MQKTEIKWMNVIIGRPITPEQRNLYLIIWYATWHTYMPKKNKESICTDAVYTVQI